MTAHLRTSPSAARNRGPILDVLRQWLPASGEVLEIAAGTGEHAAWFSAAFPDLAWRPTDADPDALETIDAWREAAGAPNLLTPLHLDASQADPWPVAHADAVVCINMVHISPWAATEGLMRGAAQVLPPGGVLYLYGAYKEGGVHTALSNAAFDESLRTRNPAWGVRDLEAVTAEAEKNGLRLVARIPMPANNLSVVFRKD